MDNEVVEKGAKCACGQTLPWHLFELGGGLRHICSCERAYKEQDGVVRHVGAAVTGATLVLSVMSREVPSG